LIDEAPAERRSDLSLSPGSSNRVRRPEGTAAVLALAVVRVAVAYSLGVSIFYALELVANLATHQSDGPRHGAAFGVLLALASLTLLASIFQTDASRFSRSFGVMTAVMLVGFWPCSTTRARTSTRYSSTRSNIPSHHSRGSSISRSGRFGRTECRYLQHYGKARAADVAGI